MQPEPAERCCNNRLQCSYSQDWLSDVCKKTLVRWQQGTFNLVYPALMGDTRHIREAIQLSQLGCYPVDAAASWDGVQGCWHTHEVLMLAPEA